MRHVMVGLLIVGLASPAFAKHEGHGHVHPSKAEQVANEAMDAVADELLDEQGRVRAGGGPPGLAKQGKLPPGLEKQGKTPPGWSRGKKTGWDGKATTERQSPLRRLIRGIFRKSQQPAQPAQ
jgi:hypothetical protein